MTNSLSSSSASVLRPDFMSCRACAYCWVARSGIAAASTGVAPPAVPPGAPACVAAAAFALDGAPAARSTGAGALNALGGALWQAASNASAPALTNGFDQLLTDFHLAVAAWIELRQRTKALLHPLIVGAVFGSRGIDLVQFDRLLLEREGLLLEQYVVLLQFLLGQFLRPLRAHQVLAQLAIQFGTLEGRCGSDVGHLVVGRVLIGLERRLHRLAFLGQ